MKAASFEYSRPRSVAEACGLLTAGEELAKPIAGHEIPVAAFVPKSKGKHTAQPVDTISLPMFIGS